MDQDNDARDEYERAWLDDEFGDDDELDDDGEPITDAVKVAQRKEDMDDALAEYRRAHADIDRDAKTEDDDK